MAPVSRRRSCSVRLSDKSAAQSRRVAARDTAEQAAAASVLVWLRRRRDYQPHTPGPQQDDLTPLPPTVAAVRAATDTLHTPEADTRPHPDQAAPAGPLTVLPPAVALTGPGALHAGRGVLVTALLTALRHPSTATAVVITRTALSMLLGPAAPATLRTGLAGLTVTASIDEALTLVDDTRQRSLLITDTVSPSTAPRLTAAPNTPMVTVVVLGTSPVGAEWHVDVDGHTRNAGRAQPDGPRLCVLDQVAATDLLTVLTHTQPPPSPPADKTAVPRPRPPAEAVTVGPSATPTQTAPLPAELRVLGKPRLLVDGQPVAIRRSAAWQALILLAVHPHGLQTRQLTDAIWPGVPAHTVTGRLYTTISELRRTIGPGTAVIEHADDRYRLDPDQVAVDLWQLHAAAHRAATALTDHTCAWHTVIDSYTGDLAAGHTWAWIDPPREATRRLVIDAYSAAAAASDPHRAVELLQAALRVDPFNAHLHRRAIDALTAVGDHTGAAALRHTYTDRLARAGLPPESLNHPVSTTP